MMKILLLIACLISAFSGSPTSTDIQCSYYTVLWAAVGKAYSCMVYNNPIILTQESAQISGTRGSHESSKSNDDVLGFYARIKTIQYFPRFLEKKFRNLKLIFIYQCELKEIHQSDLKPFPKLVYFNLYNNAIEVIEEGLFDFNPNLEVVGFQESKIIYIDPNVFDHLSKLSHFWFYSVPCVKKEIDNSISKVKEAIKVVKSNCSNSEFLSLGEQIKNLKIEPETLNSEDFDEKLESFEKSFNNSKFSKFRPLNYKFNALKSTKSCSNCRQLDKISSLDTKVVSLGENLSSAQKDINSRFDDLKLAQCGLKNPLDELKTSQNALQTTLSGIKSSITDHGSKIDQIQNSQNQIKDSMTSSINSVNSKVNDLSQAQNDMKNSVNQIEVKINDLKSSHASSSRALDDNFDVLKNLLIGVGNNLSDHRAVLSGLQSSQDDAKLTINEIKSQNDELKVAAIKEMTSKVNQVQFLCNQISSKQSAAIGSIQSSQNLLLGSLNNLTTKFNEHKEESRTSQNVMRNSINRIEVRFNDLKSSQNDTILAIKDHKSTQNSFAASLESLKTSQDNSHSNLALKINDLNKNIKSTQDETKLSISDIEAALSGHKKFQNEAKDYFIKIRTSQNEMKMSLDEIQLNKNDNSEDKLSSLSNRMESLEGQFMEFEVKNAEKLDQIEKRLMKKFGKFY